MAEFFTLHKFSETDSEAARARAQKLAAATSDEPIEMIRAVCDLEAGRMLCEWVAPSREAVVDYLREHEPDLGAAVEQWLHVDLEEPSASPPVNPEPD